MATIPPGLMHEGCGCVLVREAELREPTNDFERRLDHIVCFAANLLGLAGAAIRCTYDRDVVTFRGRYRPEVCWQCAVIAVEQIVAPEAIGDVLAKAMSELRRR